MASPGKAFFFFFFWSSSTEQKPEDDAVLSGVATSLGQNPKQKICCYQTQVSLALWGYTSTKIKHMLLGLKKQLKPEGKSGGRTSQRTTVGGKVDLDRLVPPGR